MRMRDGRVFETRTKKKKNKIDSNHNRGRAATMVWRCHEMIEDKTVRRVSEKRKRKLQQSGKEKRKAWINMVTKNKKEWKKWKRISSQ